MKRTFILAALASIGLAVGVLPAAAQDYPARPVRMVVPFAAGGGTDLVGRIVAQELTKGLNQQFYIENKAGAAGQWAPISSRSRRPTATRCFGP